MLLGAVTFDEVAAQHSADYSEASAEDEEDDSCRDSTEEVWDQEDGDSGVHQEGEDVTQRALRYGGRLWHEERPSQASTPAIHA